MVVGPQNRVSKKEVEPRWDLGGPSIGGPLDRVRSPWKVLPRVWGLRRGGLGSSGGCTTMRGTSGLVLPPRPGQLLGLEDGLGPGQAGLGLWGRPGRGLRQLGQLGLDLPLQVLLRQGHAVHLRGAGVLSSPGLRDSRKSLAPHPSQGRQCTAPGSG